MTATSKGRGMSKEGGIDDLRDAEHPALPGCTGLR